LENHIAAGMNKKSILALLGEPGKDRGDQIDYYLGHCQTVVGPDLLIFYFDSGGRLVRHAIVTT
jgi:hypothetical protein